MKTKISAILSLFSILLITVSFATSASLPPNFIQCLSNNSVLSDPISETIYTPDNSSFSSVLQSYTRNLRYATPNTPKPLLIVTAKHESHVQATVICAKSNKLEIRIRSGGHDYEGVSYVSDVPFIILDMFNLRSIEINMKDQTAWVQAGATLGELYYGIAQQSKVHAFPAGVCPSLGVGGHFGGGGYGNMMRKYGLSVDNIIDAQIVDASGSLLNKSNMDADLFWAIRGGGASSFAVVLSWKINLVPVPEIVTAFRVEKTVEQGATDLVVKWQQVADKLHEDLFIRLMLQPVNASQQGTKTIQTSFVALFLGQTDRLLTLMTNSFPELGLQRKDCIEMSWLESVLFWYNSPKGTPIEFLLERIPKSQIYLKRKSDYVKQPISKAGLNVIWQKMIELGKVSMQWNPYGGKMSEILETATPFPHRAGNIFKIQYSANWMEQGIEATNQYLNLTNVLHETMTPYVSKNPREAFLNYRDLDIGSNKVYNSAEGIVFGLKYFGTKNYDRLVTVKTRNDPDNFFRNEQSIPIRSTSQEE